MSTNKALTEAFEVAIEKVLQRVGGPMFGRVESYRQDRGRAAVQPLVPVWVDGEIVKPPKLHSVPVCWSQSTTHGVYFPLGAGSLVELVPLGHDHSNWVTTGTENVPPPSTRRVSVSDLVAIPVSANPTAVLVTSDRYERTGTWGVLYGLWKVGSSSASKAVGLNGDAVNKGTSPVDPMANWMAAVEAFCNGITTGYFGVANPSHTTFTQVGTLAASATKLKAE